MLRTHCRRRRRGGVPIKSLWSCRAPDKRKGLWYLTKVNDCGYIIFPSSIFKDLEPYVMQFKKGGEKKKEKNDEMTPLANRVEINLSATDCTFVAGCFLLLRSSFQIFNKAGPTQIYLRRLFSFCYCRNSKQPFNIEALKKKKCR